MPFNFTYKDTNGHRRTLNKKSPGCCPVPGTTARRGQSSGSGPVSSASEAADLEQSAGSWGENARASTVSGHGLGPSPTVHAPQALTDLDRLVMDDDNPVLEHNPALGAAAANLEQPGISLTIKQLSGESLPLRMPARATVNSLQRVIATKWDLPWYQAVIYAHRRGARAQ